MTRKQETIGRGTRLRFLFNDTVVSLEIGALPTFGEVAERLWELPNSAHRHPLAINLTVPSQRAPPQKRS